MESVPKYYKNNHQVPYCIRSEGDEFVAFIPGLDQWCARGRTKDDATQGLENLLFTTWKRVGVISMQLKKIRDDVRSGLVHYLEDVGEDKAVYYFNWTFQRIKDECSIKKGGYPARRDTFNRTLRWS